MVFQVIRNSLQRIVGHLCQSSSVHRCHRQLVWFCSLFLSFVSHRVRFGREIVEFGGKDGEFVRGRHVERKEREGGRASRLFLSVVFLKPLHEKKEEFTNLRWKKGSNERAKNVGTTMVSVMQSYHLVSYNLRVLYVSSFFILITPSSLIVTLKLPRTVLLLLLPDRVFILLRPRATRVPAFGFAPITVI